MKKSIPRSQGKTKQKSVRRSKKKHSRTSPEIQFKELNDKLRSTLSDKQSNWTIPAKTQTKIIINKLRNKQWNKNILIFSFYPEGIYYWSFQKYTIEAFIPKAKIGPFKYTYFKICSKSISISESGPVLNLQYLNKIYWSLKID